MVNQYFKFNTKFTLIVEKEMQKLFKVNVNNANFLTGVDAEIIFTDAPSIQNEQIKLDNDSRTHLESTLISENVERTRIKPMPYQKKYMKLIQKANPM